MSSRLLFIIYAKRWCALEGKGDVAEHKIILKNTIQEHVKGLVSVVRQCALDIELQYQVGQCIVGWPIDAHDIGVRGLEANQLRGRVKVARFGEGSPTIHNPVASSDDSVSTVNIFSVEKSTPMLGCFMPITSQAWCSYQWWKNTRLILFYLFIFACLFFKCSARSLSRLPSWPR